MPVTAKSASHNKKITKQRSQHTKQRSRDQVVYGDVSKSDKRSLLMENTLCYRTMRALWPSQKLYKRL